MTVAVVVLSILSALLTAWAFYSNYKLHNYPGQVDDLRQKLATAELAFSREKAARLSEGMNYESQLERARARRTECENAWVKDASAPAVLDHLRGLDDELQPVLEDGGQGGAGAGGSPGSVSPRT